MPVIGSEKQYVISIVKFIENSISLPKFTFIPRILWVLEASNP
jgi:hypothetical protein